MVFKGVFNEYVMVAKRKTARKRTRAASRPTTRTNSSDKTIFLLAVALVVAIGGYLFLSSQAKVPTVPVAKMATVTLSALNKSGEAGTATLTEVNGKVQAKLTLTGTPKGVPQPAHIHMGSCPTPGDVKYPLTSVVDGKSETTLNVSFDDLMKNLPLAINVHKSVPQVKVYVSCGNVTAS